MSSDHETGAAETPAPAGTAPRLGRVRKGLLAFAVGALATFLAFEGLIRLAFARPELRLGALGRWIRNPAAYADGNSEDDHWKLVARLGGAPALEDAPHPEAAVGWAGHRVEPGTYAHSDEPKVGDRRLVLLYGDSFAECATPPELCFQTLLEESDLGATHCMLNYGVGGYGVDQAYLLLKRSLDRHAAKRPIVVFSLLVESDLDRTLLGFRCWPKPRLVLEHGELVSREPTELSTRRYLDAHPVSFPSYLWRRFLYQEGDFLAATRSRWRGDAEWAERKQALGARILAEVARELHSRGLEGFVLAFHSEDGALAPFAQMPWQDGLVAEACAKNGLRLVDTRPFLIEASVGRPGGAASLYGHGAPLFGHHNEAGNRACFEALRQGILGREGTPDPERFAALRAQGRLGTVPKVFADLTLLGRPATIGVGEGDPRTRVAETREPARLMLRADAASSTSVSLHLSRTAKRFRGDLQTLTSASDCLPHPMRWVVQVDERVVFDGEVPRNPESIALDVTLDGATTLTLSLSGWRGPGSCSWVAVSDPRLE